MTAPYSYRQSGTCGQEIIAPDLVIVKTASPAEKTTLVKILRDAGATVIYREDTPNGDQ